MVQFFFFYSMLLFILFGTVNRIRSNLTLVLQFKTLEKLFIAKVFEVLKQIEEPQNISTGNVYFEQCVW